MRTVLAAKAISGHVQPGRVVQGRDPNRAERRDRDPPDCENPESAAVPSGVRLRNPMRVSTGEGAHAIPERLRPSSRRLVRGDDQSQVAHGKQAIAPTGDAILG